MMTTMSQGDSQRTRLWVSWTISCAIGEYVGMAVAVGCAVFASHFFGEPTSVIERVTVIAVMVFAGVMEGFFIGTFQWRVLRSVFPTLTYRSWLIATVTVAALGWFLGMLPSTLMAGATHELAQSPDLPVSLVMSGAALLGAVLGAVFGGAQWLVLRRYAQSAWTWIVANAIGWAIAMAILFLAASLPTEATAVGIVVLIGACAGLFAGLSVGTVTGWFLLRLRANRIGEGTLLSLGFISNSWAQRK